jgi:hypothetical protein
METIHKLLTFVLFLALSAMCWLAGVWGEGKLRAEAEVKILAAEKATLQAKWDKEQEWVGRYKTWRAEWIRKHAPATPIEPFYE